VPAYEPKDPVYRRAQREGFRSRAAYKLEELDRRLRLFRRGQRVVDLGCWPGAWLQVAARKVGPEGRVVGIDLTPTDHLPEPNVRVLAGDATDPATAERVREELGGPADVVLSDLAPKLSGVKARDAVRHAELVRTAAGLARAWLAPEGTFVAKIFMDAEFEGLLSELRATFGSVRSCKLESTRHGSSELYTCARGVR